MRSTPTLNTTLISFTNTEVRVALYVFLIATDFVVTFDSGDGSLVYP